MLALFCFFVGESRWLEVIRDEEHSLNRVVFKALVLTNVFNKLSCPLACLILFCLGGINRIFIRRGGLWISFFDTWRFLWGGWRSWSFVLLMRLRWSFLGILDRDFIFWSRRRSWNLQRRRLWVVGVRRGDCSFGDLNNHIFSPFWGRRFSLLHKQFLYLIQLLVSFIELN